MSVVLNDITKQIKAGKSININLNVLKKFEQSNIIPKRTGDYVEPNKQVECANESKYEEGDIIDIPSSLTNICNLDNYYILGVSYKYHLLEAIFYNMDEKFKFEDDTKKEQILIEFRELLKEKYPKKADMIMNDRYDLEYINMCADYFNINILCIDCDNNSYQIYSELNSNEQIIILVNMYSKYLPLLHIFGEKPNYSLCSTILKYFNDK
jgi:hypothetical protein